MALFSGFMRVFAAAAVSGGIAWLIFSTFHPCDLGTSSLGWVAIFLPAAAGLVFSLKPFNAVVCVLAGMSASVVVVAVAISETVGDGTTSPTSGSCEPIAISAVILVPITFVLLTVLLLVLHALGFDRDQERT